MLKVILRLSSLSPLISVAILNQNYAIAHGDFTERLFLPPHEPLFYQDSPCTSGQQKVLSLCTDVTEEVPTHLSQASSDDITPGIVPELIEPNPNQERFPQNPQLPEPLPEEEEKPTPQVPQNTDTTEGSFAVESITVTGSTIFSDTEFLPLIEPLIGNIATSQELQNLVNAITKMYVERGYVTSRAILLKPSLETGNIEIRVLEGSIEEIQIQGNQRVNSSYIRSRIALGAGAPLNTAKLEDKLRLLRTNPLFENVEASLRAGTGLGQSVLIVRVKEANPLGGSIGIDNYSPASVGSERLSGNLFHRNLTGLGDLLSFRTTRTTAGDTYTLDLNYRVPINAMNGTIDLRTRINRNEVIQEPFDVLDIRGESELYEISYRQPLIRSTREEFSLLVGFTFQEGQTFTFAGATPFGFGPDDEGISRTSVFKFTQEYIRRDRSGAWALRSLMNFGVDILDATNNSGDIPDGQFFSWQGQIQRVQVINPSNILIMQGEVQLTPNSLLPAQQFVVGGGQSVRGYRQNARAGDNGFRVSIEDRITLSRYESGSPEWQIAPFVELGYVWNDEDNPNVTADQRFIAGIGAGLLWQPIPGFNIKLDWALPLVDLDDRGDNVQDDGFYFSVNYQF